MPARTLWRAMWSARRPMWIASATRSTRSTVMTASAVSEETVAPAAPIAIPRSAIASAGASLTPSPTMITGRSVGIGADRAHDLELVLGRLLGVDAVDAEFAARCARRRSGGRRRASRRGGCPRLGAARRSASASGRNSSAITITPAMWPSSATSTWASPEPLVLASAEEAASSAGTPAAAMNARLPTSTRWPSTEPAIPWPGSSCTSSGIVSSSPSCSAARDERLGRARAPKGGQRDAASRSNSAGLIARLAHGSRAPRACRRSASRSCRTGPCGPRRASRSSRLP